MMKVIEGMLRVITALPLCNDQNQVFCCATRPLATSACDGKGGSYLVPHDSRQLYFFLSLLFAQLIVIYYFIRNMEPNTRQLLAP